MTKNFAKRDAKDYGFWQTAWHMYIISCWFWTFYKIMYKMKVCGRKNIPKDRSILVAANHMSLLDPPLISAALLKPIGYMAKRELFDIFFVGPMIWSLGAFAVNRDKLEVSTIKTAKVILADKTWTMALFPQGGRRRNGKLNKINKGYITLAKLTKTDILPVGIIGADKTARWPLQGNITVNIGTPISYDKEADEIMEEWKSQICDLAGLIDNSDEVANLETETKEAFSQ